MEYKTINTKNYSLAVVNQSSKLAFFTITVDLNQMKKPSAALIFEDLLLAGTKRYSRKQFQEKLNVMGADVSVTIQDCFCTISLQVPAERYKNAITLVFDALMQPSFDKRELARVISTNSNQLQQVKEDSRFIAHHLLKRVLFNTNDRRHSTSISKLQKEILSISRADVKSIHRQVLENFWRVTVGGNINILKLTKDTLKRHKKNGKTSKVRSHLKTNPANLVLSNIPSRQNIDFSIGSTLPLNVDHPDYPALLMALSILGKWGGFSGRLMSTVREQEGLTYGIYAKTESLHSGEIGYWRIMTFFAPDKALQGLAATFREVEKLYQKGVTETELEKFKTILHTQNTLVQDSLQGKVAQAHYYHSLNMSVVQLDELHANLQVVTKKDVNKAIKKYLNPKSLTIAGAGPIEKVQNDIEKFASEV